MRHVLIGITFILSSSLSGQASIAHSETFDNNDREWKNSQNEESSYALENGEYRLKHSGTSGYYYSTANLFSDPYTDFEISAKFKEIGSVEGAGYGLILQDERRTNNIVRNHFILNEKGEFRVSRYNEEEEEYSIFKDWTKSPVEINPKGEWNTLSVHRSRGRYTLKINGTAVHYHTDGDFWGKEVGFMVYQGEEIIVDDLIVKQEGRSINTIDEETKEVQRENLGAGINSEFNELSPIITHDGSTLYYVTDRDDDDQQVWYTEKTGEHEWSDGKDIGFPINTDRANFVVSVTPDHNQLILGNHYKDHEQGISYSNRSSYGWSFPKTFEIDNYYNHNGYHEFTFSPNRKVLLMVCEREDSFGERDVYISFYDEDEEQFSEPMNMGPVINTAGNETSCFIAGDGTIYFSTDGHPGYGNNDIFLVRKLDDTWLNWSEPVNLGRGINTKDWDAYFTIPVKGEYAYMVSSDSGFGRGDIFRVKVTEKARPEPVVLVKGRVLNAKTEEPIEARITYRDLINDDELGVAYSDKKTGSYQIILPHGRRYSFLAEERGYFPVSANVDLTELAEFAELEQDLLLAPVEVGVVIRLNNIFFEFNESALLEESYSELKRLAKLMKENPKLEIEIGGHTDDQGSDEYNQSLSQRRVESVVTYLVSESIEAKRFVAKGYGEGNPIAENTTEEGRAFNRRVEFRVLKN